MEWINPEEQMPELNKPILLKFKKKVKSQYSSGKIGTFITEGVLIDKAIELSGGKKAVEAQWRKRGYGPMFMDYTNRLIQGLDSKKPNSVVIGWVYAEQFK